MSSARLGDVATVVMGQSPPGTTYNREGIGLPLLNGPTEFGPSHPSATVYTSAPTKRSQLGDVLFCVRGATTGRMNWADREYCLGRGVAAIRGASRDDTVYLRAVLESGLGRLLSAATGSVFANLSYQQLAEFQIVWPAASDRARAASVLGALDDKLELNRRMNATLEALARAIFTSWFVDFDPVRAKTEGRQPVGMDAVTAALFPDFFQDSPLGPIPSGWRLAPIGEVVTVAGGSTPRTGEPSFWGGTIPFATPKDLSDLREPLLIATGRAVTAAGAEQVSSGVLPRGTVLLSSRAPIGYLAISDVPVVVNQGFIAMRCEGPLSNYYVLNWARHNMGRIVANANGTTFLEISKTNFRPIPAIVPTDDVLRSFGSVVAPLYDRIRSNVHVARVLSSLRDQLLPKLVSGEIRLPVD